MLSRLRPAGWAVAIVGSCRKTKSTPFGVQPVKSIVYYDIGIEQSVYMAPLRGSTWQSDAPIDRPTTAGGPTMTDIDLSDLAADRDGPRALRPLLRVAGIGPEPASAKDAWGRIELFFATHLN